MRRQFLIYTRTSERNWERFKLGECLFIESGELRKLEGLGGEGLVYYYYIYPACTIIRFNHRKQTGRNVERTRILKAELYRDAGALYWNEYFVKTWSPINLHPLLLRSFVSDPVKHVVLLSRRLLDCLFIYVSWPSVYLDTRENYLAGFYVLFRLELLRPLVDLLKDFIKGTCKFAFLTQIYDLSIPSRV